jgi:hypothetical protein
MQFDTNLIQAVKHGARRYAHYTCFPQGELVPLGPEADPDMIKLKEYINNKFGKQANYALINKQIKQFQSKGYTLSGILKSLVYFYDVKHNTIEKSNGGIGIVDFIYNDARQYYYNLFMAQQANKDKIFSKEEKEVIIKPPKMRGTKQQFFEIKDWDNEE